MSSPRLLPLVIVALLGFTACSQETPPSGTPEAAAPTLTSADAVLDSMVARYQRQVRAVPGYRVQTDSYAVTYTRVDTPAGPDYAPALERRAGMTQEAAIAARYHLPEVYRLAEKLRGNADLSVREGPQPVYILTARNPAAFVEGDTTQRVVSAAVAIDPATFVVRELRTQAPISRQRADAPPVTTTIRYDDHQPVGALLVPYRLTLQTSGLLEALDWSELTYMRTQVQFQEQRLTRLPPEERATAEAELARQRDLLTTGISTLTYTVQSAHVVDAVPAAP